MEKHNVQPDGLLQRSTAYLTSETRSPVPTSSDFVLQWGNRKGMRRMKVQVRYKDEHNNNSNGLTCPAPVQITTVRVDRRVVKDSNQPATNSGSNGYLNLRQRPESPSRRIIRNSENSIAMRGHSNIMKGLSSPERGGAHDKRVSNNHAHTHDNGNTNHHNGGRGGSGSSETAHDSKKGGGSSTGNDAMQALWPPKFVIALTNKEKEEDFLAIKGSKLPQRPKKRTKFMQRTVNLISPGTWLCELTLERYEVREKKVSKKRPRGLKAMGNMESDSE